jgi:hypothetical protein
MRAIWLAVFAVAAYEVVRGSTAAALTGLGTICLLWLPFLLRRRS